MSQSARLPWQRRPKVWAFVSAAAAFGLVLLHLQLLWSRVVDQTLTEPGVVVKWLFAGGVVVGLGWLHRRGVPLWGDRRALALWLIALCLHTGTISGISSSVAPTPMLFAPAEPWLLLPLSTVVLGATLVLLGALTRAWNLGQGRLGAASCPLDFTPCRDLAAAGPTRLPRPPPALV